MFERFTELARQVVVFAQDEARILKHNYIGAEHVLLGLLRVEEGLAAQVLTSLEITVERVRIQVVRIVGSGDEVTSGQIPFTPAGKKVLELSLREALALSDDYVGTGHILLGLIGEDEGLAVKILREVRGEPKTIRDEVLKGLVSSTPEPQRGGHLPTSRVPDGLLDGVGPSLRRLVGEVQERLGRAADGGDLLVVLASVHDGIAARTLARLGVDANQLAAAAQESRADSAASTETANDEALLAEAEQVREEKEAAISAQEFERAAHLRDRERQLRNEGRDAVQQRRYDDLLAAVRTHLAIPAD